MHVLISTVNPCHQPFEAGEAFLVYGINCFYQHEMSEEEFRIPVQNSSLPLAFMAIFVALLAEKFCEFIII